jgi:DNA polymerase-4
MDAFFAAVEQRDNPELKGRPVIVGGDPNKRGVVSTCSYEARAYGVRSAMPSRTARRLCPQAVFLPVDMKKYARVSGQIMDILKNISPVVEQVSVDEAFLDVTERTESLDSVAGLARRIKNEIRKATGLSASVGVAGNKFLAKIASDLDKPDGLTVIRPEETGRILRPLPVSRLWGVGKVTQTKLNSMGIRTVADLLTVPESELEETFGKFGGLLYRLARGQDDSEVVARRPRKSISSEITFPADIADISTLVRSLETLCRNVAGRLHALSLKARTVTVKVRFADFSTVTRSKSIASPVDDEASLFRLASVLLAESCRLSAREEKQKLLDRKVRLVGVAVSNLHKDVGQIDLFSEERKKAEALARIVGGIRERFGEDSIVSGRGLRPPEECPMSRRENDRDEDDP